MTNIKIAYASAVEGAGRNDGGKEYDLNIEFDRPSIGLHQLRPIVDALRQQGLTFSEYENSTIPNHPGIILHGVRPVEEAKGHSELVPGDTRYHVENINFLNDVLEHATRGMMSNAPRMQAPTAKNQQQK